MAQDERRGLFEAHAAQDAGHNAIGLDDWPGMARRLLHSRDLGEPFDFLTWFEFAPCETAAFDALLRRLRGTPRPTSRRRGHPGPPKTTAVRTTLHENWPEYVTEACGLGILMLVAAATGMQGSAAAQLTGPFWLRIAGSGVVAATGAVLTHSRWGRQSGARFNPAATLCSATPCACRRWTGS